MGLLDVLQSASNAVAGNVAGPVDILSLLLRKGGIPIPDEPLGGSEWMKRKGLMRDVPMGAGRIVGETAGLLAPTAIAAKAPQIARGLLKVQENAAAPRTLSPEAGVIVYHGSPHKFDKFDASKIGTGEGTQAYGHGLYLAESPKVAKSYQHLKPITDPTDSAFINARAAFDISKGKPNAALQWLDDRIGLVQSNAKFMPDKGEGELAALSRAKELIAGGAFKPGNLYKADLPDEQVAKMLDASRPLSQQPESVRAFFQGDASYRGQHTAPLQKSGAPLHDLTGGGAVYPDDVYSPMAARYYGQGEPAADSALFAKIHALRGKPEEKVDIFRAVPKEVFAKYGKQPPFQHGDWVTISRKYAVEHGESTLGGDYKIMRAQVPAKSLFTNGDSPYEFGLDLSTLGRHFDSPDVTGLEMYKALAKQYGDQGASELLASRGIPGIRYLDGGSRGAGQGTYNYVVFPGLEDQIKILERNGVPLGLLGR
jgi:hypothetical protein